MVLLMALVLAFLGCSSARGDTAPAVTAPLDQASLAPLLGINIDPRNASAFPTAAELAQLGATRVRIELKVDHDPNVKDAAGRQAELEKAFAFYDGAIGRYASAQIPVLLILDYATLDSFNGLAAGGFGSWDDFANTFAQRAGAIAARYDATAYEIWNEEDLCADPNGYCPRLSSGDYVTLLRATAAAVHGARPGARVIVGGLASGQWESYAGDVASGMGGDFASVDGIGFHPYTFWPSGLAPNRLEDQISRLAAITGKPLFMTEWGDGGSEQSQAAIVHAYLSFFADPNESALVSSLAQSFLFSWSSTQQGGSAFGVLDDAGQRTPSWGEFHVGATAGGGGGTASGTTTNLHGTVTVAGVPTEGITVTAWGHDRGDFHKTATDAGGVYAFTDLVPSSPYNLVVNAAFENGSFVPVDPSLSDATRDNVTLTSGPDGWHGENFNLDAAATPLPPPPPPPPPPAVTSNLHGTVNVAGAPQGGLTVTAWGHDQSDLHETTTDPGGIYAFSDLDASSQYNIVVNARFESGGYVAIDPSHGTDVRNNVALVSGPDGWHGENFDLAN